MIAMPQNAFSMENLHEAYIKARKGKRGLGVRYYLRYVDDFILLHKDPSVLLQYRETIKVYLKEHLELELKEPYVHPVSVYKGIDFLGYFVKPRYTLVRRRVVKNLFAAIRESLPPKPQENGDFLRTQYLPEWKNWQTAQSRINSYLAHAKFANAKHLEKKVAQILQPFSGMVQMEDGYVRLFRPHRFPYFYTRWPFLGGNIRRIF